MKNIITFIVLSVFVFSANLVLAQSERSAPASNSPDSIIGGSVPRAAPEQTVLPTTKVTPIPTLLTPTPTLQSGNVVTEQTLAPITTPQIQPTRSVTPFVTVSSSSSILPIAPEENSANGSSFPMKVYGVIVAVAGVLAVGGYVLFKSKISKQNNNKNDDPCKKIKIQLDQKEAEFNLLSGGFSLKEIVLKELEKKLEDKKKEIIKDLENKAINKVLEFDESGKIKKTVDLAREIKKRYDDLADKYNKAKKVLELLKKKRGELEEEIKSFQSSYGACMAARGVIRSAINQGGISIETSGGNNKLYRYLADGEGVWSAGKRLLPPELVEEVNRNRAWLKKPDLSEDNYRFWLTEAGKEKYEQTLYKIHQKYLSNIVIEEISKESLGKIIYEDKFQVVEKYDKPLS